MVDSSGASFKQIADPIHKTIALSELEMQIVSSSVFQRLRNVRQLGLVHYVFPGADYSRFSHSIGVCHVAGRILNTLELHETIHKDDKKRYRIAALLHDIGHFPFSHTMEHVIKEYYTDSLTEPTPESETSFTCSLSSKPTQHNNSMHKAEVSAEPSLGKDVDEPLESDPPYFDHLRAGAAVLEHDPELRKILKDAGFEPEDISRIFRRELPDLSFAHIISSDLDADRLDYLLRTAHHSGLPYGTIDIDYLLAQMRRDQDGRMCITPKALNTADHFLLSRYFDYQQIIFHKTVAAFEEVLERVLALMLNRGVFSASSTTIREKLTKGEWSTFDDLSMVSDIRRYHGETKDAVEKYLTGSVIFRDPPKQVASLQFLGEKGGDEENWFSHAQTMINDKIPEWADLFKIPKQLWFLWDVPPIKLTAIGSRVAAADYVHADPSDRDRYEQSVRILDQRTNDSQPIIGVKHSLMYTLSSSQLYALRLYVLFPNNDEKHREAIRQRVIKDLPFLSP